jgi:hypothetical protein
MIAASPATRGLAERADVERRARRLAVEPIGAAEAWDFHQRHADLTTPYTRPDFAEMLATAFGPGLLRLGVFGERGMEAVVQLAIRRRGPLGIADQTPFPYVGLMSDGGARLPSQLLAIRRALARERVAFAVLSLPPQVAVDLERARGPGVFIHPRTTCVVPTDAASLDAVEARWARSVRRATRDGLRIERATAAEMSGALAGLTAEVLSRSMAAPPDYREALFPTIWETFEGDGDVFLRVAHVGDRIEGLMFSIRQGATMYADGIARHPATLGVLILDLARLAARHGCTSCDITGGPPKVVAYKERWGASVATYHDIHIRDPLLGTAHDALRRARLLGRALTGGLRRGA